MTNINEKLKLALAFILSVLAILTAGLMTGLVLEGMLWLTTNTWVSGFTIFMTGVIIAAASLLTPVILSWLNNKRSSDES